MSQEQRRGCLPKADNKQFCFFFFRTLACGRAASGSGRHRGCGGCRRDARAGQAPGRMRGPGRRRPRPPAQPRSRRSPWQRARGGRGRAAWAGAAAISAASCSSRPRRHGNGVTHRGRFPARLARVTPAARAPSSLTCCAAALPPTPSGVLLRHPGPSSAPRRPILPPAPRPSPPVPAAREGGRREAD